MKDLTLGFLTIERALIWVGFIILACLSAYLLRFGWRLFLKVEGKESWGEFSSREKLRYFLEWVLAGFLIWLIYFFEEYQGGRYDLIATLSVLGIAVFWLIVKALWRKKKGEIKNPEWYSFYLSAVVPGLGQTFFAGQWQKLILFLVGTVAGFYFSFVLLFWPLAHFRFTTPLILALGPGIYIWNLNDAYQVGRSIKLKLKEKKGK